MTHIIVLAAGKGSRLKKTTGKDIIKSLVDINGITLIEHVLDPWIDYGYNEGFKYDIVLADTEEGRKTLSTISQIYSGLNNCDCLKFTLNPYPDLGTGYGTYLALQKYPEEPCIVIMGDHILQSEHIELFMKGLPKIGGWHETYTGVSGITSDYTQNRIFYKHNKEIIAVSKANNFHLLDPEFYVGTDMGIMYFGSSRKVLYDEIKLAYKVGVNHRDPETGKLVLIYRTYKPFGLADLMVIDNMYGQVVPVVSDIPWFNINTKYDLDKAKSYLSDWSISCTK